MSRRFSAVASTSTDPHVNLAFEDHLLATLADGDRLLLFYRNRDSVVIGRHQNPWIECDLAGMRSDGVLLARRQSGGGGVFHDLGNTNYSVLSSRDDYDQDRAFAAVLEGLHSLDIPATRNGRNDLVLGGRKFSGSAFRHRRGKSFQHGTLLIDADLDRLTRYLTAPHRSIAAKGTMSVRSSVVNLAERSRRANHETVCSAVAEAFGRAYLGRPMAVEYREPAESEVVRSAHELRSWEWLFGKTPDFDHHLQIGDRAVTLHVHRGIIGRVEGPAILRGAVGARYESAEICRALFEVGPRQEAADLCKMLEEEIP